MGNAEIFEILRMLDGALGTNITGFVQDIIVLVVIAMLVLGALQCFMGYKLFRFFTAVSGFIAGALIGAIITALGGSSEGTIIVCAILFGALGAFLAYFLYKVGVFLTCYTVGTLIGVLLGSLIGEVGPAVLLGLICGIALGVIGVKLVRPVIIISTSLGGGITMGAAIATAFSMELPIGVAIGLIIGIFGCFVQFGRKSVGSTDSQPAPVNAAQVESPVNYSAGDAPSQPAYNETVSPAAAVVPVSSPVKSEETVVIEPAQENQEEQRLREERQQKIEEQKEAVKQFASDVASQTGAALKKGGEMAKTTSAMLMEKGKALSEKAGPAISKFTEDCKTRLADAQRKTIVCENCGKAIDADSKFCDGCGAAVTRSSVETANVIFCASCGKKLTAGSKFCDGCGTKVQ